MAAPANARRADGASARLASTTWYLSGQRCWTMSGDGPNGQSSPDKLFNDRSADRAEPGDDVQFRLAHGCHWGILGPGLVG